MIADIQAKTAKMLLKLSNHDEMHEDQGYNDKEDESLGMKDGKESDKEASTKQDVEINQ